MSPLDSPTRGLVSVAAAVPDAPAATLEGRFREARGQGTSTAWLDELVLASVLFVGFPRALVAAAALRAVEPAPSDSGDLADFDRWREWLKRGEETCRRIYGPDYEKLRSNVTRLHPALDSWIVVDGYGRVQSRPALDLRRRELCSIAMLVAQDAPRQLHSHLCGALNAGATPEEVDEVLDIVAGDGTAPEQRAATARAMWQEVRSGA